jgi:RNase adaptor protein for sRNA GlmZ degradation
MGAWGSIDRARSRRNNSTMRRKHDKAQKLIDSRDVDALEKEKTFLAQVAKKKDAILDTFDRSLESFDERVRLQTAKILADYIIEHEREEKEEALSQEIVVMGAVRVDDKTLTFDVGGE